MRTYQSVQMFIGGWLGLVSIVHGIMLNILCILGSVVMSNPLVQALLLEVGVGIPVAMMALPLLYAVVTGQFFANSTQKDPHAFHYSLPLMLLGSLAHIGMYVFSRNMGIGVLSAIGNAMMLSVASSLIVVAKAHYDGWQKARSRNATVSFRPKKDKDTAAVSERKFNLTVTKTQTPGLTLHQKRANVLKNNNASGCDVASKLKK